MTTAADQILEALRARERETGLGTRAFAKALGVSPTLWALTRHGRRPLTVATATAAARLMPDLEPLVLIFLRYELPNRKRALHSSKT